MKSVTFTMLQCLYIDNREFTFELREQLKIGVQVIHNNFSHFGLDIHIGK